MIDGFCKQNGERTDYNKKGSNEDKKWRVAVASDSTMQLVYNYCVLNHIQEEDYIFVREGKRPLRKEYLEDVFERQLKKAGIEKNTALFTIYIHYSDAPRSCRRNLFRRLSDTPQSK